MMIKYINTKHYINFIVFYTESSDILEELKNNLKTKFNIEIVDESDLENIIKLQKMAYISEAKIYNDFNIEPLKQTIEELNVEYQKMVFIKKMEDGRLLGSVRAYSEKGTCYINKLIVHPNVQNKGIGSLLLEAAESIFDDKRFEIFTGNKSKSNIEFYKKRGYKKFKTKKNAENLTFVYMEKVIK